MLPPPAHLDLGPLTALLFWLAGGWTLVYLAWWCSNSSRGDITPPTGTARRRRRRSSLHGLSVHKVHRSSFPPVLSRRRTHQPALPSYSQQLDLHHLPHGHTHAPSAGDELHHHAHGHSHSTVDLLVSTSTLEIHPGWLSLELHILGNCLVDLFYRPSEPKDQESLFSPSTWQGRARKFYEAGSSVALALLALLPLALLYLAAQLSWSIAESLSPAAVSQTSVDVVETLPLLLLPGVTLPLRELPILLLASFLAILLHEAGHAVAAAVEGVPILGLGFVLVVCFPGAYVSLQPSSMELLPDRARVRVIAAGVWHNLLLWTVVAAVARVGLVNVFEESYRLLGYDDLNDHGVVVQSVQGDSPLSLLLQPRDLVTHLDDLELHDSSTYQHWRHYLLGNGDGDSDGDGPNSQTSPEAADEFSHLGWCIPALDFAALPADCCEGLISNASGSESSAGDASRRWTTAGGRERAGQRQQQQQHKVCFQDLARNASRCIDPSSLLNKPRCLDTCTSSHSTSTGTARTAEADQNHDQPSVCVFPHPSEQLLRLTVQSSRWNAEQGKPSAAPVVVFYQGSRSALFQAVKVDKWRAPWWAPQSLPLHVRSFWSYLQTVSQSLAVFNLLPLPRLDGDELVEVLLSMYVVGSKARRRVKRVVNLAVGAMLFCVVGLAVWRSSM